MADVSNDDLINESNWGEFVALALEAEAEHWQNEYDNLTAKHGSYGAKKSRAAWVLGASMLRRRAGIYRTGDVRVSRPVEPVQVDPQPHETGEATA